MKKRKNVMRIFLLLNLSIALCACGGNTKKGERNSNDNSVIVGIQNDMDSLDPHKAKAAGTEEVLFNLFEGLVKPDKDGNLVPAVASDVLVSEDGKTLSFPLREGVKFHNGSLVTAEDVIYSIKRCAGMLETSDPEVQVEKALSSIAEVNEYTTEEGNTGVRIILNEANTDIIGYLTCAIIPKDYADMDTHPIGTGPFKFVSYTPLHSLVMEKNEEYYIAGVPYLDQVTFKISASSETALMELMAGSIDIYPYMTSEQAKQLPDTYHVEQGNMNLVQGLFLNNAVEPFNNALVRQAMYYAIDRQLILDMVSDGSGTIVGTPIFPQFVKYYDEELASAYPYDIEKAKELLAQAGYPDGFQFTITVPSAYQFHVDTAQVIVESLKKVNINAQIQLIEWATWLSDVYNGRNFESTIIGLEANMTPSNVMFRYVSTDKKNFINYANSDYDKIYQKALTAANEEDKVAYYKQLQEILSQDAASIYLQDPSKIVAVKNDITGYEFYPVYVQDMSTVKRITKNE